MSEHTYPPHMPKESPRASVRIAWDILDSVRPGVIPNITRIRLAEQIASALIAIDEIQEVATIAVQLRDHFVAMDNATVGMIAGLSPELIVYLTRLSLRAPANENKDT